jgi:hypothetical protein
MSHLVVWYSKHWGGNPPRFFGWLRRGHYVQSEKLASVQWMYHPRASEKVGRCNRLVEDGNQVSSVLRREGPALYSVLSEDAKA